MADKIYPPEFLKLCKAPTTKAAFVSDVLRSNPKDCKNCGGIGTMVIFIATAGGFRDVPSGVAKFVEDKWWSGKNYEEMCPVCKGSGIDTSYVETYTVRDKRVEVVVEKERIVLNDGNN